MSWDASLVCDACRHAIGEWNYTYNTTPMVSAAAEAAGIEDGFGFQHDLNGMNGADGQRTLRLIIREMEDHPATYRAMNPENGWGDYAGILGVLREMADATPEAPTTWSVS